MVIVLDSATPLRPMQGRYGMDQEDGTVPAEICGSEVGRIKQDLCLAVVTDADLEHAELSDQLRQVMLCHGLVSVNVA